MASFGMMPPPIDDEYSQGTLSQLNYVDRPFDAEVAAQAPTPEMQPPPKYIPEGGETYPPWAQQLRDASSTPPSIEDHMQNELKGVASHMKPSQDGAQNNWLSSLAPILAGAAAVLGAGSKSNGTSAILRGVSRGYANHLMDTAKEQASLKHESDTKTIDLAHKYLQELPGDVDPAKYPRLAELGQKIREQLVNGKLSNPKEAQDFILEFTHYKNDIEKEQEDTKYEQEKRKARAPYEAFQEAANAQDLNSTTGSAWIGKFGGGMVPDPQNPGTLVHHSVLSARETAKANAERAQAAAAARHADVQAQIAARHADVATQEGGRNTRSTNRLNAKGGSSSKEYDAVFKAATAHARALDSKRPSSDPKQIAIDTKNYLADAGHTPTQVVGGKTYYWHTGQGWTTSPPGVAGKVMAPPPSYGEGDDFGEEDNEFD